MSSKRGYLPNGKGLSFELGAYKCYFPQAHEMPAVHASAVPYRVSVAINDIDYMFKCVVKFAWLSFMNVENGCHWRGEDGGSLQESISR